MKYLPLFFFTVIVLISCSKQKTPEKKSAAEIEADSVKLVAKNLGVQNGFPSTFTTTYEFQKYLSNNNKVLITRLTVVDLLENDSVLILTIQASYSPEIYMDLTCHDNQIKDLLNLLGSSGYLLQIMDYYSAVVEITSFEKVKYGIETSVEDNSYQSDDGEKYIPDQTVNLSLGTSNSFTCKGKLIRLYTKPTI